jgi:hypothetical protein
MEIYTKQNIISKVVAIMGPMMKKSENEHPCTLKLTPGGNDDFLY